MQRFPVDIMQFISNKYTNIEVKKRKEGLKRTPMSAMAVIRQSFWQHVDADEEGEGDI